MDVILDNIGGAYFQKNLESLGMDGRLFIIGFMGGVKAEANISFILAKRLTVQGNTCIYFCHIDINVSPNPVQT